MCDDFDMISITSGCLDKKQVILVIYYLGRISRNCGAHMSEQIESL
jgi:hypothetical protein